MIEAPKLFVSYCWSSPEHEQWVVDFATQLRQVGINAILDKWDLREGHDSVAFMEQMVTNPDVKKVAMICDKKYAEKADDRSGGVGTETQIISANVYRQTEQNKFVAIVTEYDENGRAYVPTYYQSRIYIDLSTPDKYNSNFEQVVRWGYDRPIHQQPEMGKPPLYITEPNSVVLLNTDVAFRRAIDAVRNSKSHAEGSVSEYFDQFVNGLKQLRLMPVDGEAFDETVIKNIEAFLPYRNQAIDLFTAIATYNESKQLQRILHRFFERLMTYLADESNYFDSTDTSMDNFRFLIHELFLYSISVMIQHDRFSFVDYLLRNQYINHDNPMSRKISTTFASLQTGCYSFEERKKRLKSSVYSFDAQLIRERCTHGSLTFAHLVQADLILYIRSLLQSDAYTHWHPNTLVFAERMGGVLEVFARARSRQYFDEMKIVLGFDNSDSFETYIREMQSDSRRMLKINYRPVSLESMLGLDSLCSTP